MGFNYFKRSNKWYINCRDGSREPWANIIFKHYYLKGQDLPSKSFIHHKNENSIDDSPENLELTTRKKHPQIHLPRAKKVILRKNHETFSFSTINEACRFLGLKNNRLSLNALTHRCRTQNYNIDLIGE